MNIRDIAKLAGVSVASVSRAINGKDPEKVSARTREKILRICEQQRFSPNGHMRRLSERRANTVAFLVPAINHYGEGVTPRMDDNMSAAILGAEEELSPSSTFLTLATLSESFLAAKTYLEFHRNRTIDGILVWGWEGGDYLHELIAEGVPTVLLQGEAEGTPLSSVSPEDREGMSMLVDHLVGQGHRRIAVVTPLLSGSIGRERRRGILDALQAHGLAPAWVSRTMGYTAEVGYQACQEILAHAPETTCIMASNDLAALGVIKAARERGLDVPGQLSVTGADGVAFHGLVDLTTYASPSYAIGRAAARLLLKVVETPEREPEHVKVGVNFMPGATVAKPAASRASDRGKPIRSEQTSVSTRNRRKQETSP